MLAAGLAAVLAEPALGIHGRHRTSTSGRDRLPVDVVLHVTRGINTSDTGHRSARNGVDVTFLVLLDFLEETRVRDMANRNEGTCEGIAKEAEEERR
jgi:hypothetical protein